MFADVTSANVVGYMDVVRPTNEGADAATNPQYQNFFSGSLFNNVGEEGYSLADLSITGPTTQANGRNNYIVFWAMGSSVKVDFERAFWWDPKNSTWRRRSGKTYLNLNKAVGAAHRVCVGQIQLPYVWAAA